MKIVKDDVFRENLQKILLYISKDSKSRASKFNSQLGAKISKLSSMPYKFRPSYYYDDKNVRDFIFKGYTIPYLVDENKDLIVVLDIFKWSYKK